MHLFSKILIANRGEIACRIIRTCRRLGIQTVAIFSEADAYALHTEQADEAFLIGPPPAQESYLQIEKIIEIVRKSEAEAVHPGYGFLSENAIFAEHLSEEGIALIGPSAEVIRLMGDKLQARAAALKGKVNVIPGSPDPVSQIEGAREVVTQIGFPIMIKAAAGGGGKGMRLARNQQELEEGLSAAQREAQSSFGDARVFIERFIETPRHIEVQVLGDTHGNVIHLGERECSIQRRHQKVIEESPSPFITSETRELMTQQAVNLAQSVGYTSAGTVEFIVDQNQQFYFLEMNTRLQVEHAVTEMVTGRDLVEDMIRIAGGERLPLSQEEITFSGHSVEARVYAEDPAMDFVPSPGKIHTYREPGGVRIDTGVEEGDEVSLFYDPMIAKVITHGPTRDIAFQDMTMALNQYVIEGPTHNLAFLTALSIHPKVLSGQIHTHFIEEEYPKGFRPPVPSPDMLELFKQVALLTYSNESINRELLLCIGNETETKTLKDVSIQILDRQGQLVHFQDAKDKPHWLHVHWEGNTVTISGYGSEVSIDVYPSHFAPYLKHLPKDSGKKVEPYITTPMPGKLIQLMIREGDRLQRGQPVAIVEAMKMENILRASHEGAVKEVYVQEGETLESHQKILEVG